MTIKDRIHREQIFHDRQAGERAAFLRGRPEHLLVSENRYVDHEPWIRPALASLGDLRGKRVLEFGCGHGMAAVVLAKRGARVTAFDLSGGYLDEARGRARANRVTIDFLKANGEFLPFADGTFDCIWGNAVLHHLDLAKAGREIRRVLKPEGRAVFCEPWGGNAFLNWARHHLPYPGKKRTPEETPLTREDLAKLRVHFPHLRFTGHQLFSMVGRVLGRGPFVQTLAWCDHHLLQRLPWMERWCRYAVITLLK